MSLILTEIIEKLKREDEIFVLELLEIDSEMLVERFSDLVEYKQNYLEGLLDD